AWRHRGSRRIHLPHTSRTSQPATRLPPAGLRVQSKVIAVWSGQRVAEGVAMRAPLGCFYNIPDVRAKAGERAMSAASRIKNRSGVFTFDDFCLLVKDGQKADLIDGVIYMASPDNTEAADLNVWLCRLNRLFR